MLNSLAVMGDVEGVSVERSGSEPVEAFKSQRQTHAWRDIFFDLVQHRLLLKEDFQIHNIKHCVQ